MDKFDRFFHQLDRATFSDCDACKAGRCFFFLGNLAVELVLIVFLLGVISPNPFQILLMLIVGGLIGVKFYHGLNAITRAQTQVELEESRRVLKQTIGQLRAMQEAERNRAVDAQADKVDQPRED